MKKTFTPSQEKAISARGCDLAVSAAAGSGKTTVLTERILSLLSDPDGIDAAKLVVVTFTKTAAQELEDRLYGALSEKVGQGQGGALLSRQLFRLSRAQISTIHSFAFSLIREYRKELGLGQSVRIADPMEASVLQRSAVEEAIGEFFDVQDEAVYEERETLYRLFGSSRSSVGLTEALLRIQNTAASYPGGIGQMWRCHENMAKQAQEIREEKGLFFETPFGEEICGYAKDVCHRALLLLETLLEAMENSVALSEKYLPYFAGKRQSALAILSLIEKGNLPDAGKRIDLDFAEKMPTIRSCPEEEAELKKMCQDTYNERIKKPLLRLREDYLGQSRNQILSEMEKTLILTENLLRLATLAKEKYDAAKREKDLVDYQDLEHMTLSLLMEEEGGVWKKTALADRIASSFDAIFVDEYQDTNAIQDMIFCALSRNGNLFVVGDPKQSIYRFRGAEPSIFSRYKNELPLYPSKGKGMQKILLSDNFRCDETVIRLVNRVFCAVMEENAPDSLYQKEDQLRFSKVAPQEENRFPTELVLVTPAETDSLREDDDCYDEAISAEENREAAYLAGRIGAILSGEIEKKPGEKFKPSDIAVICRTHLQIAGVKKSLDLRGIPNTAPAAENIKEEPEYLFVSSLLSALDNPTRDIPFLGALTSPVFRFDADELYRVRKHTRKLPFYTALVRYAKEGGHPQTKEKCREALDILEDLREQSKREGLCSFLFSLYSRFQIDALYQKDGRALIREVLLSAATAAARASVHTLGGFCQYLEEAELTLPESQNGVQLLTIHKSKGLEFPIVFVSFLGQPFSTREETATLLLSSELGALLPLPMLDGRAKMNTILKKAAKIRLHREALEEEKRVLYVALTRAKTKLILTSSVSNPDKVKKEILSCYEKPLSDALTSSLVRAATSPLSMLLPALRRDGALLSVLDGKREAEENGFLVRIGAVAPFALWEAQEEPVKEMPDFDPDAVMEALSFVYPEKGLEILPQKLSVSEILREKRDDQAPEFFPRRLMDFEKGVLLSGAEKIGTATHQVMQFADFKAMEENPEQEFARLVERGFLSEEDMALVEKEKVLSFFDSALYARMKKSEHAEHEKRFHVLLPAEELGVGEEGEVLVQGVVDAWFENPDGTLTLLDFKTDRVKEDGGEAILRVRHADQLRLYALAVEKMTGRAVRDLYLYSFSLKREIQI